MKPKTKMQNCDKRKVYNFISENGISALISKFEAKNHLKDTDNTKMSRTEVMMQSEEEADVNVKSEIASKSKKDTSVKSRHFRACGKRLMNLVSWFVFLLSSVNGAIATTLTLIVLLPRALIKSLFYPGYRLLFGTLYPAYASYKAVRTRNVKEYVSVLFKVYSIN